ncbi:MAG: O-antigen ligase family protein [Chloroflexi bacterium]|nr:O-antigen ligase family protein [Chloroflexota bacterium]
MIQRHLPRFTRTISDSRRNLLTFTTSLLILLIVTTTYSSFHPKFQRMGFILTLLGVLAWIMLRNRSGRELSIPWIGLPLGALILLGYVLSLRSPVPVIAWEKVSQSLPIVLALLLVTDSLAGWWKANSWENALVSFAVLFTILEFALAILWLVGWWRVSSDSLSFPPVGYRPSGLFLGHANIFAGYLNLVIPIAIVRSTTAESKRDRSLWYLVIAIFLLAQLLASSRGGWLAGIAAILTTLAVLHIRGAGTGSAINAFRRHWIKMVTGAGLLLIGTIIVLIAAEISPGHAPLLSARSGIWEPAWAIIRSSPVIGHGPASFSALFAIETQIPPGFATSHAHNLFLQTWAELGLLGLILLALAGVCAALAFVGAWRTRFTPRLAAYAGAGVAVLLHHQLDYLFESPGYLIGVIVIIGLLYRLAPDRQKLNLGRGWAAVAIGSFLIPFVGSAALGGRGAQAYWTGVESGRHGDWQNASERICLAMDLNPSIPLYASQCGLALAFAAEESIDAEPLIAAEEAYQEGLSKGLNWPMHWANLGAIQWSLGETGRALESLARAAELAPRNPRIAFNLGWMQEQLGDPASAQLSYRAAISSDPWLQFNPLLSQDDSRAGSISASELYPNASDGLLAGLNGWAALRKDSLRPARDYFTTALGADPSDALALAGLAKVAQAEGHSSRAMELIRRAIWLGGGSANVNFLAGSIALAQGDVEHALRYFEDAARSTSLYSESAPYYARTYLRYYLEPDAVPQLVGLGIFTLSSQEKEDIIEFLKERKRQDLIHQFAWTIPAAGSN